MTHVTILGSGTLLPDDDHRSAAHLVEGPSLRLLLDCGSGAVHGFQRWGVAWRELTHVAISHFHTDHFGDLAPLLWALKHGLPEGREEVLTIVGPRGLRGVLEGLAAAHGEFVLDPGFPLEIVELESGDTWVDREAELRISTHSTRHTPESLAYRLAAPGTSVGYTGDTGHLPALGAFFQEVSLLISECALADGSEFQLHLTPSTAAALARDAGPGTLVLTHLYPEVDRAGLPDRIRELGYAGPVHVARDGLRLELDAEGPARPVRRSKGERSV